jgi:formiminotetrahydrofolate cyclodeaminase
LAALLGDVAAATPAPGGGSSAAVATALAAALVEMSARIAQVPATPDRARALRERCLALADEELTSYAPVLEAERLPADDPERAGRLEAALGDASRAPLEIAEAAAEIAALGAKVAAAAGVAVRGDATTGTLLAEAAAAAAATLVETNLRGRPDDPSARRAAEARLRAHEARERALAAPGASGS